MMDKIVSAVRQAAQFPSVSDAFILSSNSVSSKWTQPDVDRGEESKFCRTHVLADDLSVIHRGDAVVTNKNIKLESWSPSRVLKALITTKKDEGKEEKYFIEIWNKMRLLHVWDLSAKDVHGSVYTDGTFGCLSWNKEESQLAYIAEKKYPKTESPFSQKQTKDDEKQKQAKEDEKPNILDNYLYREDWAEQLTGKHHSVVCLLAIKTGEIHIIDQIEEGYSPGQVKFVGNSGIVGSAWNEQPYRLGLVYCSNRNSHIFFATFDGHYYKISEEKRSVSSPSVCPDGSAMVYLDREEGGPHQISYRLVHYHFKTKKTSILLDNVAEWDGIGFAGLYTFDRLPAGCWIDNSTLVFNCIRENQSVSYVVKVSNCATLLKFPSKMSFSVLDTHHKLIVGKRSSFSTPDCLVVGRLPEDITEETLAQMLWVCLDDVDSDEVLKNINITHMKLKSKAGLNFNGIMVVPQAGGESIPWILYPHGGPHSVYTDAYSWGISFYLRMGMGVVLVNFTGSIGQGDAGIKKLLGHIGSVDVRDVHEAGETARKLEPRLDSSRKFLIGGSHGGFLVAHLTAQYPNEYKACSARNPVIDVSSMLSVSDIPDWNFVESGLEFTYKRLGNSDVLKTMFEVSPLRLVDQVKTPTLLLVGEEDRRVPPSQSFHYYKMLKARGVPVRLLRYPDCHPLAKVQVSCDVLINTMKWFLDHM